MKQTIHEEKSDDFSDEVFTLATSLPVIPVSPPLSLEEARRTSRDAMPPPKNLENIGGNQYPSQDKENIRVNSFNRHQTPSASSSSIRAVSTPACGCLSATPAGDMSQPLSTPTCNLSPVFPGTPLDTPGMELVMAAQIGQALVKQNAELKKKLEAAHSEKHDALDSLRNRNRNLARQMSELRRNSAQEIHEKEIISQALHDARQRVIRAESRLKLEETKTSGLSSVIEKNSLMFKSHKSDLVEEEIDFDVSLVMTTAFENNSTKESIVLDNTFLSKSDDGNEDFLSTDTSTNLSDEKHDFSLPGTPYAQMLNNMVDTDTPDTKSEISETCGSTDVTENPYYYNNMETPSTIQQKRLQRQRERQLKMQLDRQKSEEARIQAELDSLVMRQKIIRTITHSKDEESKQISDDIHTKDIETSETKRSVTPITPLILKENNTIKKKTTPLVKFASSPRIENDLAQTTPSVKFASSPRIENDLAQTTAITPTSRIPSASPQLPQVGSAGPKAEDDDFQIEGVDCVKDDRLKHIFASARMNLLEQLAAAGVPQKQREKMCDQMLQVPDNCEDFDVPSPSDKKTTSKKHFDVSNRCNNGSTSHSPKSVDKKDYDNTIERSQKITSMRQSENLKTPGMQSRVQSRAQSNTIDQSDDTTAEKDEGIDKDEYIAPWVIPKGRAAALASLHDQNNITDSKAFGNGSPGQHLEFLPFASSLPSELNVDVGPSRGQHLAARNAYLRAAQEANGLGGKRHIDQGCSIDKACACLMQ